MPIKNSLISKIFFAGLLASVIYFLAITLLSYYLIEKQVHQIYLEKAQTIARSMDASIRSRADLSPDTMYSTIQKNIWLDPDVLSITLYSKQHGALVSTVSNRPEKIGVQASERVKRAFFEDVLITQKVKLEQIPALRVLAPLHFSRDTIGALEINLALESYKLLKTDFLVAAITGFIIVNALVLFVFVLYVNSRVSKPVKKILAYVNKIAGGDFDVRLPVQSKDELGDLTENFNRMALSLERQRKEILSVNQNIEYQATHDMLTGLPNRYSFQERIRQNLIFNKRHHRRGALMMMDLDQFKSVNDTLGHHAGDELLKQVASRLSQAIRQEDMLARLGGDEFVVLISEVSNDEEKSLSQVHIIVDSILKSFSRPFRLETQSVKTSASIGVVFYPQGKDGLEEIMKNADAAMYKAKEDGGNCSRLFDQEMQRKLHKRVDVLKNLRNGIKLNELHLFYQPQVDAKGKLISAEALVRWMNPEKGLMSPHEFIDVAENNELILEVGEWVINAVCQQIQTWRINFPQRDLVPVSINVSSKQFHQKDFCERVINALEFYDIPPCNITLEITESALLKSFDDTRMKMQKLKQFGVRFSIDDFGTGFSSLAYLKQLPVDEIKIDRSFVRDMMMNSKDGHLVNAIINMSLTLDLNVVAEGVENQMQFDYLIENHCKLFQGFLFDKPLTAEQFEKYL